tara:strand:+ start:400 stop:741 length:342 start_codon:yes stop_codon:yes gene_type:complete
MTPPPTTVTSTRSGFAGFTLECQWELPSDIDIQDVKKVRCYGSGKIVITMKNGNTRVEQMPEVEFENDDWVNEHGCAYTATDAAKINPVYKHGVIVTFLEDAAPAKANKTKAK